MNRYLMEDPYSAEKMVFSAEYVYIIFVSDDLIGCHPFIYGLTSLRRMITDSYTSLKRPAASPSPPVLQTPCSVLSSLFLFIYPFIPSQRRFCRRRTRHKSPSRHLDPGKESSSCPKWPRPMCLTHPLHRLKVPLRNPMAIRA